MRIVLMGTGPFAVPAFASLLDSDQTVLALVTRPVPEAAGRRQSPPNPSRELAESRGLSVLAPADVNAAASCEAIESLRPDLLVVCDYGQILAPQTLKMAPLGGINLHGSLLPRYRGAAPIAWAMYHGDPETGVTVIHVTPRLDSGPSLVQLSTPIAADEDAVQLEARLARLGVEAVQQAIELLAGWDGSSPLGQPQDRRQASRAPRLQRADGAVDWARSAEQIRNQVRAFKPWPGTFTALGAGTPHELRLILDAVSVAGQAPASAAPGEIVLVARDQLLVATGEGLLSLDRVQPSGKRPMGVAEFLRGHSLAPGQRFSSP